MTHSGSDEAVGQQAPGSGEGRIRVERIRAAARSIDPVFLGSPQYECESLGGFLGIRVLLKVETMNPIRCFKGRGAAWLVANATAGEPLACASAGNFGQAMAYACRRARIPLSVHAAHTANPLKVRRMRELGANVVLAGSDFDEAKVAAREAAEHAGNRFVEDGLDPEAAEGAGTIGLELLELARPPEDLLVPLGNGALFGGVAHALRASGSTIRLIAVQAAGAPAMIDSIRERRVVEHRAMSTIADGIAVRLPIREALDDLEGVVDDALLVSEDAILEAMRLLHRKSGLVSEPSGAVGLAALLEHRDRLGTGSVGLIVTGGNVTEQQLSDWF